MQKCLKKISETSVNLYESRFLINIIAILIIILLSIVVFYKTTGYSKYHKGFYSEKYKNMKGKEFTRYMNSKKHKETFFKMSDIEGNDVKISNKEMKMFLDKFGKNTGNKKKGVIIVPAK